MKYDTNRRLIQFADDKVFDFEKQRLCEGRPHMAITKALPFKYVECQWPEKTRKLYLEGVRDVAKIIADTDVEKPLVVQGNPHDLEIGFGHPDVVAKFKDAIATSEALTMLHTIFKFDLNDLIYFLQHFARQMGSYPRLCELLYMYGPKK